MNKYECHRGYWLLVFLFRTREQERHEVADKLFRRLDELETNFLIPFPTLYEAINTKLLKSKNRTKANWFLKQLQANPRFIKVPDDKYKDDAYLLTVNDDNHRGFSLVDMIIRVMMEDDQLKINSLLTFNIEDFVDVAARRGISIPEELFDK